MFSAAFCRRNRFFQRDRLNPIDSRVKSILMKGSPHAHASLTKWIRGGLFIALGQLALATLAHGQTAITLEGQVMFSTGQPAAGATVTMTKTIYVENPPVITIQTVTADGSGHYNFE